MNPEFINVLNRPHPVISRLKKRGPKFKKKNLFSFLIFFFFSLLLAGRDEIICIVSRRTVRRNYCSITVYRSYKSHVCAHTHGRGYFVTLT